MTDSARRHADKVQRIADQIRAQAGTGGDAHIAKKGVPHFVPLPGDRRFGGHEVDIRELDEVLEVDVEAQSCTAEPGVSFATLLRATLPVGLIPTVVPELEGITLGGAVAGCSVESMSYRYGGFHDSCLEYEIVKSDGEVMVCSPLAPPDPGSTEGRGPSPDAERRAFAFEMIHGSYGTLAILTRLTFRLLPAKPLVRLEHHHFHDFPSFERALIERCQPGDHDFVDAIVHAPDDLVMCLGYFVDQAPYVSDYRRLDIYHESTRERDEDYLSTFDYCFRYDTECHWMTNTVPPLRWRPVRALLGKYFLGSTNLISWSNRLSPLLQLQRRPDVVCDVFIPARRFAEFFSWYVADFDFFPLWVIPYRIETPYPWVDDDYARGFGGELFIDCAVYGKKNTDPEVDYSELLEKKTTELGGLKTLISRNHFTRDEFWSVFNRDNYERAKRELDPAGMFPNVYDKFHRNT